MSYGIPFLVPLTAGVISALLFGDILFFLIRFIAGV
ncbi:MAG TPA: A24 family peptidase C-terminal domain-containing protein [Methanolinea sp.]|nr:A24 family peptidase C-terminal domain-containing protein [Methanolinea sp.]HPC54727.1 A24 family peptidase C-terminal domain-containing protein [Methanolinea sp.]HQE85093.1 A24 family peptidase C-terminal domain-containing protein [Methanolinea sp.]HQJ18022.1 A24 family peptidase C-terminal domain-containing protein [Methanolinea sp.]HRS92084.1 A24 family peptidase C-terminal domain-containing protein [Methanolinea sp.]